MSQSGRLRITTGVLPPSVPIQFSTDIGGPAVPVAGNLNVFGGVLAAGTNPLKTTGSGDTLTINSQFSQALAATDASKVGLSNFNSAEFTVDANGFVSLIGGGEAIDSIGVDATTGGGTNPVLPTAAGLITTNGARVAAGSNPVRTVSTAVNVYQVQVQTAQALAATDATKVGLANFNSAQFSVDANGFVSAAAAGIATTITGDSGGALSPSSNNWNIFGGPGVTTTGSGSTLTINSVVFTDQGGSGSVTSDSGSFVTGAFTMTLPATPAQGEVCEFVATSAAVMVVDAPGTQLIRIGNAVTSAGGTCTSSGLAGDSLVLRYSSTGTTWESTSVIGNWVTA